VGHRILGFLYGAAVWYSTKIPAYLREGSLGGVDNTAPSSSDVIPMGSKRFALQGTEYAFSSSVRISTFFEANPTAVTGAVLISLAPFGALDLVACLCGSCCLSRVSLS
jgi:hypothetical protein